ncbi:uncharacterized protein LOC113500093 [Trichoplusia ni]|uniref:Uncharacterized protein LOC113500093 n=1 Tax=Trichoplusia ni TaxID=7111 RepID=A0A7E5W7D8_TRINI|nr:uncharacterized protein LOC113500093 [Trichoplusia ni]
MGGGAQLGIRKAELSLMTSRRALCLVLPRFLKEKLIIDLHHLWRPPWIDTLTIRNTSDRWAKVTTLWEPAVGRRRRGPPRKRWRDDLNAHHAGWLHAAQTRDLWKDLGDAFAKQWGTVG